MHGSEQFIDTTFVMFLKLALSALLGGIIGTERAVLARQAAGTRTFSLVALGSCLFIVTSSYVSNAYLGMVNIQPTHVMAAVVTGIGFLGAGLIIFRGDTLHGVTTAAALWIVAALGVAVGFGLYAISLFTTVLTLMIFTGMWFIETRFKHWFENSSLSASTSLAPQPPHASVDESGQ